MKMNEVICLVNGGLAEYKFSRFGNVFCGLLEESFSGKELEGRPFGYIRMKGKLFFRKLK
ncbi:MAG: hypothetical protein IKP60_07125 [Treponema sp.]|nr:hypothetical protein [Treponema sp.]